MREAKDRPVHGLSKVPDFVVINELRKEISKLKQENGALLSEIHHLEHEKRNDDLVEQLRKENKQLKGEVQNLQHNFDKRKSWESIVSRKITETLQPFKDHIKECRLTKSWNPESLETVGQLFAKKDEAQTARIKAEERKVIELKKEIKKLSKEPNSLREEIRDLRVRLKVSELKLEEKEA